MIPNHKGVHKILISKVHMRTTSTQFYHHAVKVTPVDFTMQTLASGGNGNRNPLHCSKRMNKAEKRSTPTPRHRPRRGGARTRC